MRTTNRGNSKLPEHPPVWAETFGEDQYGLFAECAYQGVAFVFRWIPPGRFLMGAPMDELVEISSDERPQHEVILTEGFWLGETPVTKAQWETIHPVPQTIWRSDKYHLKIETNQAIRDLMKLGEKLALGLNNPSTLSLAKELKTYSVKYLNVNTEASPDLKVAIEWIRKIVTRSDKAGEFRILVEQLRYTISELTYTMRLPKGKVSWQDAIIYCKRLTQELPLLQVTLPTEAQWEYACRAGTTSSFNDGSACTVANGLDPNLDRLGWFRANSGGSAHPVRLKQPNGWGLYDMHGNVWEWCLDDWDPRAYEKRGQSVVVDPESIITDGTAHIVRGGSWFTTARNCRASYRNGYDLSKPWSSNGLRLCVPHERGDLKPPRMIFESAPQPLPRMDLNRDETEAQGSGSGKPGKSRKSKRSSTTDSGRVTRKDPHFSTAEFLRPHWAQVYREDQFGIYASFTVGGVVFPWRWIPPGRFLMGSPINELGHQEDEAPQHWVKITKGFWMGETPVTHSQWKAIEANESLSFRGNRRPVESVTWYECVDYVRLLNKLIPELRAALPSEAQWEYACRSGTSGAFHDGSSCTVPYGRDPALDRLGWFDENSDARSHQVGQKSPNDWGLYDLHGNVWEWCRDAWDGETYQKRGSVDHDPEAPLEAGALGILRGGSWYNIAGNCRAAFRGRGARDGRWPYVGFRLCASHEVGTVEPAMPIMMPKPPSVHGGEVSTDGPEMKDWSDEAFWSAIETIKRAWLSWDETTGSARKWWEKFEDENRDRPAIIYQLAEELRIRGTSIAEFFLAHFYSEAEKPGRKSQDGVQDNGLER